ncbi:unnamed protein product [Ostreobium quekettii]|uniref:CW-type domain-containing protein n=1 Tax=Ostreobium quekettii TaxID=121088 RepID=A0A8S1IZ21_9CHLO|nr:unnamed protein product [Ostreobium quekettii]
MPPPFTPVRWSPPTAPPLPPPVVPGRRRWPAPTQGPTPIPRIGKTRQETANSDSRAGGRFLREAGRKMPRRGDLGRELGREGVGEAALERMESLGMIQREFWIQCDGCGKWRRTTAKAAEDNSTRRWLCGDDGRACCDPCDYCAGDRCRCDALEDDDSTCWAASAYHHLYDSGIFL